MKYLLQTVISENHDGSVTKFEIFSDYALLDHHRKIPEGSCRILKFSLERDAQDFVLIDSNLDVQGLFDANQPKPNTWYSDGQDRVSMEMLIEYLSKI